MSQWAHRDQAGTKVRGVADVLRVLPGGGLTLGKVLGGGGGSGGRRRSPRALDGGGLCLQRIADARLLAGARAPLLETRQILSGRKSAGFATCAKMCCIMMFMATCNFCFSKKILCKYYVILFVILSCFCESYEFSVVGSTFRSLARCLNHYNLI